MKSTHTKPKPLKVPLDQPSRLFIAEVLGCFNISQSTLHEGVKLGKYPKPDGRDGRRPYWLSSTIRDFLTRK